MEAVRGGIYILSDSYTHCGDLLVDKRPIIALNSEKRDSFFSGVRMGIFKSYKKDNLFIELEINNTKYFSTILCDRVLDIPKKEIQKEIGTLDERTLNIIENKLFNKNKEDINAYSEEKKGEKETENYINERRKDADKKVIENVNTVLGEETVQAKINVKDTYNLEKVLLDTKEMVTFLKKNEIEKEKISKKNKKIRKIVALLTNVSSFLLGVLASYIANHFDKEITSIFQKIISIFERVASFFANLFK